jgi:hypothetical protein
MLYTLWRAFFRPRLLEAAGACRQGGVELHMPLDEACDVLINMYNTFCTRVCTAHRLPSVETWCNAAVLCALASMDVCCQIQPVTVSQPTIVVLLCVALIDVD